MKTVFLKTIRTVRKIILLILVLSILTLMLNLFLPIITLTDSTEPNKVQYLNFETMKYSSNLQISELSNDIDLINLLLWTIVAVGIVTFIGLIISISEKYSKIGNRILLACCSIIIFSLLSLIFLFLLTKKIIDINNISLASIFGPISYIFIQIILIIFLTICSIYYVFLIVTPYIKKPKEEEPSKKEEEKFTRWSTAETKKLDELKTEKK